MECRVDQHKKVLKKQLAALLRQGGIVKGTVCMTLFVARPRIVGLLRSNAAPVAQVDRAAASKLLVGGSSPPGASPHRVMALTPALHHSSG